LRELSFYVVNVKFSRKTFYSLVTFYKIVDSFDIQIFEQKINITTAINVKKCFGLVLLPSIFCMLKLHVLLNNETFMTLRGRELGDRKPEWNFRFQSHNLFSFLKKSYHELFEDVFI